MSYNTSPRFGNVVQYPDFDKNVRLEKYIGKIERILTKNGFRKCHIPSMEIAVGVGNGRYQDAYKVIAGDGQVLTLPGDPAMALMNTLAVKRNENCRFFGLTETFSFLKNTNPQNGYVLSIILTSADGYYPQAEMCALALEMAQSIGLNDKVHLSNSDIAQGIVDYYAKKAEAKNKVSRIINGNIESESDYASAQCFSEIRKIGEKAPKDYLRSLADCIENQKSLDGILDIYEVLNLLEIHGLSDKIAIDPLYIGSEVQSGTVFYIGDDVKLFMGGKSSYSNGQEIMNIFSITIDLMQLSTVLGSLQQEHSGRVSVLVAGSSVAYQRGLKFKDDFYKNGLVTDFQYNVQAEEAEKILMERSGKENLVLYIDEGGNIKHN